MVTVDRPALCSPVVRGGVAGFRGGPFGLAPATGTSAAEGVARPRRRDPRPVSRG